MAAAIAPTSERVGKFCKVVKCSLSEDEGPEFERELSLKKNEVKRIVDVNKDIVEEALKLSEECKKFSARVDAFQSRLSSLRELQRPGGPFLSFLHTYEGALTTLQELPARLGQCLKDQFARQVDEYYKSIAKEVENRRKTYETSKQQVSQALVKLLSIKKKQADDQRVNAFTTDLQNARDALQLASFDYYHELCTASFRQEFEFHGQLGGPLKVQQESCQGMYRRVELAATRHEELREGIEKLVTAFADDESAIGQMRKQWEKGSESARRVVKMFLSKANGREGEGSERLQRTDPDPDSRSVEREETEWEGRSDKRRGSVASQSSDHSASQHPAREKEKEKEREREREVEAKKGYLFMQTRGFGGKGKHWKRRWFEVEDGELRVFRRFPSPGDRTAFKFSLPLRSSSIGVLDESDRLHCFFVSSSTDERDKPERFVALQAESEEMKFAWMRCLVTNGCVDAISSTAAKDKKKAEKASSTAPRPVGSHDAQSGGAGQAQSAETASAGSHLREIEADEDWWLYATEEEVEEYYLSLFGAQDVQKLFYRLSVAVDRTKPPRQQEAEIAEEEGGREAKGREGGKEEGPAAEAVAREVELVGRNRKERERLKREFDLKRKTKFSNLLSVGFEDLQEVFRPKNDGLSADIYETLQMIHH